jgi:hypothetical protein
MWPHCACAALSPLAANHIYAIERNSRLLWEQWEPIFRNTIAVQRDKEAYEKLEFRRDVYFEI